MFLSTIPYTGDTLINALPSESHQLTASYDSDYMQSVGFIDKTAFQPADYTADPTAALWWQFASD